MTWVDMLIFTAGAFCGALGAVWGMVDAFKVREQRAIQRERDFLHEEIKAWTQIASAKDTANG